MLRVSLVLVALLLSSSFAQAEKRIALVIGNSAYSYAGELANPRNDASDMAAALTSLGFEVIAGLDLDKAAIERKLREYARKLEGADVALFFYAGHGLQIKGVNLILGIDAKLEAERDIEFETVKLDAVLTHMEREAKTTIVFLDACRNNPLARNLARTMGTRGVAENGGLAPVTLAVGTFIAFATQPGNVASDGSGRNSPFTAALKKHISAPGVSVTDVMVEVRNEVVSATNGGQVPWDNSSLRGRFYFKPSSPPAPTPPIAPSQLRLSEAAEAWDRTKDSTNIAVLGAFSTRFKDTFFAELARARIAELSDKPKVVFETPKGGVEPPKAIEPPAGKKRETPEPPAKVAALPKAEKQANVRQFDGAWMMSYKTGQGCPIPWSGSQPFTINNGVVSLQGGGGRVTASGFASGNWVAPVTGTPLRYQVNIRGDSGTGTYVTKDNCRGVFAIRRN